MQLSGYKTISSCKAYVSDFSFRWPKVRSILWLSHYKAMGKPYHSCTHQAPLLYCELSYIWQLITQVPILVGYLHGGHLGHTYDAIRGHQQVFDNNSQLKRAGDMGVVSLYFHCHDASTDMQHYLLGSTFDLRWPWLEANSGLTFLSHHNHGWTCIGDMNTLLPDLSQ